MGVKPVDKAPSLALGSRNDLVFCGRKAGRLSSTRSAGVILSVVIKFYTKSDIGYQYPVGSAIWKSPFSPCRSGGDRTLRLQAEVISTERQNTKQ